MGLSPFPRQSIHLFICWFIYFPRLDGGSDLLSEACRGSGTQRMLHKSGRRTEEQSTARSGAGHSHGLHARVWKVGDQTEGRTKCWRLRLFALVLGHGRMIIELFRHPTPPKKTCLAASLKQSNLFIWQFLICCFSDYSAHHALLNPQVSRKINVHNASCFCNDLALWKRSLWI